MHYSSCFVQTAKTQKKTTDLTILLNPYYKTLDLGWFFNIYHIEDRSLESMQYYTQHEPSLVCVQILKQTLLGTKIG